MFTGIVEEVGRVRCLAKPTNQSGITRMDIKAPMVSDGLKAGDSVAVNGACLTVVALDDDGFTVELAPETLWRTGLGSVDTGCGVNLERPLPVNGRLGGHIVQGHIDGTGKLLTSRPDGECALMSFRAPKKLMPYIVEKGFVAVDGISLTVVKRGASSFVISVIPYTVDHTILKDKRAGDSVNLEVDVLAKYVESLLRT